MATQRVSVTGPRLWLQISERDGARVVRCSGRLTVDNTDLLKTEVRKLIPGAQCIVLDLTDLTYMDSSGLGTLVGLYVSCKTAHCSLELINLSKRVRELLGLTNVLAVFQKCGEHMINFR